MKLAVVLVDCAEDRIAANANHRALTSDVDGRAPVVTVSRANIGVRSVGGMEGATRGSCFRAGVDAAFELCDPDAVLFTDTNTQIHAGWFDAALAAFGAGAELLAGPVTFDRGRTRSMVDVAGFVLDYGVHEVSPFTNANGHPSANNFGASARLLGLAGSGDLWKTELCVVADAHLVHAVPVADMAAQSHCRYHFEEMFRDHLRRGHLHASLQRGNMSVTQRLMRVLGTPAVPLLATYRLRDVRLDRAPAWGLVFVGHVAWAIGEEIGRAHV